MVVKARLLYLKPKWKMFSDNYVTRQKKLKKGQNSSYQKCYIDNYLIKTLP